MVEVGCNVETSRPTLLLRPQQVDTQNIPVDLTFSWCSCSWAFDLVGQEKYEVVVEHWKQAVVAARAGELFFLEVTEGEDPTNILLVPHES